MASSYNFGIVPKGLTRGHRGGHMHVTFNYGAKDIPYSGQINSRTVGW